MQPTPTHHRAVALVLTLVLAMGLARVVPPAARATPSDPVPPAAAAAVAATDETAAPAPPRGRDGPLRLDPNRADAPALERLPGIGPSLARRIVAARLAGRVFRRADDLRVVRGIGPRTVERLAPFLRFDPAPDGGAGPRGASATGPR